jgi:hypothetical protein
MSYPLAGGFIPIIIYQTFAEGMAQADTILTENNFDILAETGQELLRE